GRGLRHLDEELTAEQAKAIYPLAMKLAARHRLRVKLDCSFAPMVFWHRPSRKAAEFFGVQGCVAGDVLAAVTPEGAITGCSFCGRSEGDARAPGTFRATWPGGFREVRGARLHRRRLGDPPRGLFAAGAARPGASVPASLLLDRSRGGRAAIRARAVALPRIPRPRAAARSGQERAPRGAALRPQGAPGR